MKFLINNKGTARNFTCDQKWSCISISSRKDEWPELQSENRVSVLRLAFADVSNVDWARIYGFPEEAIFGEETARSILNFYDSAVQQGAEVMMVHCEAGVSRSPGVAAALSKIHLGTDQEFFDRYTPNMLVYSKILTEHYDSQETPEE